MSQFIAKKSPYCAATLYISRISGQSYAVMPGKAGFFVSNGRVMVCVPDRAAAMEAIEVFERRV